MGLNLQREGLLDWIEAYGPEGRATFLERLEEHVGQAIDPTDWQVEDDAYPKVGSYTTYGVFRDCLLYLVKGDYGDALGEDEDIEREALEGFRAQLRPASLVVPYAAHLLESGDSDTIFIPLLFDVPLAYDDRFVASLPGAVTALESFARGLAFDLEVGPDPEFVDGRWLPVSTAKNVARILYAFFTEKRGACVVFA